MMMLFSGLSGYLTVTDVENATVFHDVVVKETESALEFIGSDFQIIVEVRFYHRRFFKDEVEQNRSYYREILGVGERAALATPGLPYRLTFLQGDFCVILQTPLSNGKALLTADQLLTISQVVSARLLKGG